MSTTEDRFSRYVKVAGENDCWTWTGATVRGYGSFWYGRREGAHRVAWMLWRGPIPDGLYVLHRCDNRGCVNPDHLFLGTHLDNMRDRDLKGRTLRGFTSPCAKFTPEKLVLARRYREEGMTYRQIGDLVGMSNNQVYKALSGQCKFEVR